MLKTFLCLFASAVASQAATLNFSWNANPPTEGVTNYKLYTITGTARTLRGTSATTQLTITIPDGIYTFALTATNEAAESDLSSQLRGMAFGTSLTPMSKPSVPTSLRVTPPAVRRGAPLPRAARHPVPPRIYRPN